MNNLTKKSISDLVIIDLILNLMYAQNALKIIVNERGLLEKMTEKIPFQIESNVIISKTSFFSFSDYVFFYWLYFQVLIYILK